MVLGLLAAVVLFVLGALALVAARHVGSSTDVADLRGPARLAALVHDRVGRTAQAVDVLVDPRPSDEVLRRGTSDPDSERTTLAVTGVGLVFLSLVLLAGVVLLLAS